MTTFLVPRLETEDALERHPKVGASWEGFAILDRIDVVYEGQDTYAMADKIRALPLSWIFDDL